jgi:hypothetical protein
MHRYARINLSELLVLPRLYREALMSQSLLESEGMRHSKYLVLLIDFREMRPVLSAT